MDRGLEEDRVLGLGEAVGRDQLHTAELGQISRQMLANCLVAAHGEVETDHHRILMVLRDQRLDILGLQRGHLLLVEVLSYC
jgi:hypothetical protein